MTRASQMNGCRPSPLAINKGSRQIDGGARRRNQPVIIYTQSPKIIHTKPRDFMALVQDLTGMTRPDAVDPPETRVINSIFGDFPLFTPHSAADFFYSPQPTVMDFIKGLPHYS